MTQPRDPAVFVRTLSGAELWCFSFVTLFNLQGTRPPAQRRNICYLITSDSVCQVLFSTFFKIFFCTQLSEPSASQTACLFYQTFQSLSSTFFKFLENFFRPRRPLRLRLRQLADSSRFKSVCQVLFQTFFKLLSPTRRSRSFPS